MNQQLESLVIGAGPAGLATSRELSKRGIRHIVLERGPAPAFCWSRSYDSLRLHTGKHLSTLPGLRFPRGTSIFPARDDFVNYLREYARRFAVPAEYNAEVIAVTRNGGWNVRTAARGWSARTLVFATGIMSNPVVPMWPGRERFTGMVLHSVEYVRPDPFRGRRVLVIGVGNSGGEIASDLGNAGIDVCIAVRSGANVVPRELAGVPIQYFATLLRKLPRSVQEWVVRRIRRRTDARRPPVLPRPNHSPLDAIPIIGFHLVDAIVAQKVAVRPGIESFTATGVRFTNGTEEPFDVVLLATGFRPALGALQAPHQLDDKGFALRTDRVRSSDYPDLFFVGHNYDTTGGIRNIARDAPLAAQEIAELLGR